ncbi:MAG: hypothetical protein ACTHPD_10725 [Rhizomicrobium sp.]
MSELFNPYDFANPVTNMQVFADRQREREEIDYYLDLALTAPRHINIALVGQRASGKTSLLNYIDQTARIKQFITCRIDLDEENVSSSYAFFFKIFDTIISQAIAAGHLGGPSGQFYEKFRDLASTFDFRVDPKWMPFLFPPTYARVMAADTSSQAPFPDNEFAADLDVIARETGKKFCLIFDECDLLGNSRGILQKLRNIIQKSTGFIFVLAGTPNLFPVMDDVFSPIVRQFKKIEVRDFVDIDDTLECIQKPLELLSERVPSDFFPFDEPDILREIHTLTSGRPYEVQLLCHSMFKRVQQGHASKMSLDLAVLEDVQNELVSGQALHKRQTIRAIRHLSAAELRSIQPFCSVEGGATLQQIIDIERIAERNEKLDIDELNTSLTRFVNDGLLSEKDGKICFEGDTLDKIYAKYFAREKKVPLPFLRVTADGFFSIALMSKIAEFEGIEALTSSNEAAIIQSDESLAEWRSFVAKFDSETSDPYAGAPNSLFRIYMTMLNARGMEEIPLRAVGVILPWTKTSVSWFAKRTGSPDGDRASRHFEDLRPVVEAAGGSLTFSTATVKAVPTDELLGRLAKSENARFRNRAARAHVREMYDAYIRDRDVEAATFYADCVEKLNAEIDSMEVNNVGYLLLRLGKYVGALRVLNRAYGEASGADKLLPAYNLALAEAANSNLAKASELLSYCINEGKLIPKRDRAAACLLVPTAHDGSAFQFEERWNNVDIWASAKEATGLIEGISPASFLQSE